MLNFDPSRIELRPGDVLRFSDGAEEIVISARGKRVLVRTPELSGVVNHFLYHSGLCYARLWHRNLDDQAIQDIGNSLGHGDLRALGGELAAALGGAEAKVQDWGGKTGSHRLCHLSAEVDRGDGSGDLAVSQVKAAMLSLEISIADAAAIGPRYKSASAYYARLLETCPEVMTFQMLVPDGDRQGSALAVVCPPLQVPVVLIYGSRPKDVALLTEIA